MRRSKKFLVLFPAIVLILTRCDFEEFSVPHAGLAEVEKHFREFRHRTFKEKTFEKEQAVNVAFVSCGGGKSRFEEVSVFLKSLILSSRRRPLHLIAFTDNLREEVASMLAGIAVANAGGRDDFQTVTFDVRTPSYPAVEDADDDMYSAFAPCASLRLFFPDLLAGKYRRVLYADTDAMFLGDPADVWDAFEDMEDEGAAVGMVQENAYEQNNVYSYSFIPSTAGGLNSGVMLMDLRRMREGGWSKKVVLAFNRLKRHLAFVDQDILNLIFHHFPSDLHVMPCSYNFRPDFCLTPVDSCPDALNDGPIAVLHGSRSVCQPGWPFGSVSKYLTRTVQWYLTNLNFIPYSLKIARTRTEKQALFKRIYSAFRDLDLSRLPSNLTEYFKERLGDLNADMCGSVAGSVLKTITSTQKLLKYP